MKLDQWLSDNDESYGAFGRRIGLSRQAVHRYCTGQRIPRPKDMLKITAATSGAVVISDFYGDEKTSAKADISPGEDAASPQGAAA